MSAPPAGPVPKSSPPSSSPSGASPATYRRSLRNMLLDPKFQLKYTGILVGFTLLVSAVLVGFLWKTSRDVIAQSREASSEAARAIEESKKLSEVVRMNIVRDYGDNPELLAQYTKDADRTDRDLELQVQNVRAQSARIEAHQRSMLAALVSGLAMLVACIGLFGIYVTHKVAGPLYKIRTLLRRVSEGNLVFQGRLRRGDELQDFFDDFAKMVDALRSRQAKDVDDLAQALKLAREGGASVESIAKIERVHDEMKKGIEG